MSIGLPVHNGGEFLAETLDSLLAQDFADFELIISDNASDDATEAICRRHAEADGRVRYLRQAENRGAAWNYNHVFAQASADLFKWAAYDDLCAPRFLSGCLEEFDKAAAETVLVYPRAILIDENTRARRVYHDRLDIRDGAPHRRLYRLVAGLTLCNAVFGLIRRAALASTALIGGYPHSDRVLLAELVLRGWFREVREGLFARRIHPARHGDPDDPALQAWFDPATEGRQDESWSDRLDREHRAAIDRAPLSEPERTLCHAAYRKASESRRRRRPAPQDR